MATGPTSLWAAAAGQALEATGMCVAGVFAAVSTGSPSAWAKTLPPPPGMTAARD